MKHNFIRLVVCGFLLVTAACASQPTPAPTATSIPLEPTTPPPLLSKPPELVLATTKVARSEYPEHVVYTLPDMDRTLLVTNLPFWSQNNVDILMDVYYPPNYQFEVKLPVVILLHGFSILGDGDEAIFDKDMQQHIDWAKLIAASGMIAVSAQAHQKPAETLNHALDFLVANADQLGIDAARIGFWGCSAQGWPANTIFPTSPYRDNFRAAAFIYSNLTTIPTDWPKNLSLFVEKSGRDENIPGSVIDKYVEAAQANNIPVDYITLPDAVHAFDIAQDNQSSKDAIQKTLDFFKSKLLAGK